VEYQQDKKRIRIKFHTFLIFILLNSMKFYSIALIAGVNAVDLLEAEEIVDGLVKGTIKAEGFKDFTICAGNI